MKTESDLQNFARAVRNLVGATDDFLSTEFLTLLNELAAQNAIGGEVPEAKVFEAALQQLRLAAGTFFAQHMETARAFWPALVDLVGAPSINDREQVLDYFQAWLIAQSKRVQRRGFSKTTTPTVSGTGAGVLGVSVTDVNSQQIDVGQPDVVTLRCTRGSDAGLVAGRTPFAAIGLRKEQPWDEGGAGDAGDDPFYRYGRQGLTADFSTQQKLARAGRATQAAQGQVLEVGPTQARGNLLSNGDFQLPFGSTGGTAENKIPDWTIVSGHATLTELTSGLINGARHPRATADFLMVQLLPQGRLRSGAGYGQGIKVRTVNGGSGTVTGTLTVKVKDRDAGATHWTTTVDLSTLTPGTVYHIRPVIGIVPYAAEDLQLEIELASLGGTAATPTVDFTDARLGDAFLYAGHLLCVMDGETVDSNGNRQGMFRTGDKFTLTTTVGDSGTLQKYVFGRPSGRYVANGETPTSGWEDEPLPAPVAALFVDDDPPNDPSALAHEGTDAVTETTADPFARRYVIRNDGNAPMGVTGVSISGETNVAVTVAADFVGVLRPGQEAEFTLQIDPDPASSWTFDLHVATTDEDQNPYDATVSGTSS